MTCIRISSISISLLTVVSLYSMTICASAAQATIIYNVNRTIGSGTVTGFIETDGTLGMLTNASILTWSLTLDAPNLQGGSPDTIESSAGQHTITTSGLTATSSNLLFDFSYPGWFILQGAVTYNFWCLEGTDTNCTGLGVGEHMGFGTNGADAAQSVMQSGVVAIASVPEPSTALLMAFGMLGLAAIGRRD